MTRAQLKALIEPTQDGGKFSRDERDALHQSDPLMAYIESAIDGAASDVSEVWESLQYAIEQLKRASNAIENVGEALTDDDAPTVQSGGAA